MRPDRILEHVWPGRAVEAEPLRGGITKRNFRVPLDGEAYVVRVPRGGRELLSWSANHKAWLAAARSERFRRARAV
ncbi:MAG TPA: hypothetical protein VIL56_09300 [Gaiellaceae bacterium]|jgi:transposase